MSVGTYSIENAARYDWGSVSGEMHPARLALLQEYLVGERILDAGCGGGAFVDLLSRQGFDAVGVDLYPEFLEVAATKQYRGTFLQGSVTDLPFADKSFDCACCFDVLEHVDDMAAIRELARVTRRRILASVPREDDAMVPFGLTFRQYQDRTHLRYYTPERLQALGDTVGATRVQVLPELPLPARELVHFLMADGFGGFRANLEQDAQDLLREVEATMPPPSAVIDAPPPPLLPDRVGPRSAMVRQAVQNPSVQQSFSEGYRLALQAAQEQYRAHYEQMYRQTLRQFFEQVYLGSLQRFVDQAAFTPVFTGLAVVIDLEA